MKKLTHYHLLLFLVLIIPFLLGIGYLVGFNKPVYANVVLDSQSSSNGTNSWTHVVGSGLNRILIVGGDSNISSVTYNGTQLTLLRRINSNNGASGSIWYFINPASGSHTISVTGGTASGSVSYSNIDIASPFGAVGSLCCGNTSVASSSAIFSNDAFTAAGQLAFTYMNVVTASGSAPTAIDPQIGSTLVWRAGSNSVFHGALSKLAVGTTTSMAWIASNVNGDYDIAGIAFGIKPAPIILTPTPTPTPFPTLTPTPTPIPFPTPTPPPGAVDIVNLNFGISNFYPWIQSTCGNIRLDNGVDDRIPSTAQGGAYMIITGTGCNTPGVLSVGDGTVALRQGQASNTGWVAGGTTYPESYGSTAPASIATSYNNVTARIQQSQATATPFPCTISNCVLPNNLASGVYTTPGDLNLRAFTVLPNRNYTFLVGGNLLIQGAIIIPQGSRSSALFTVRGNITIDPSVGTAPNSAQTSLDGLYSTDRSFIISSTGNCPDLRLNIGGAVITNATLLGGTFRNDRDLCGGDATYPTVSITQRLDILLNTTSFLSKQNIISQEVAP
jgi:hypothetical protein